jgi:purine nucleosidase
MSRAEVAEKLERGPGAARATGKMLEHWKGDPVTFHDPLAAALVFEPSLCQTALGVVQIACGEGPESGRSGWSGSEAGKHRVCSSVDSEGFFEAYFRMACGLENHV